MILNWFTALYYDTSKRQYHSVSINQYLQIEMKAGLLFVFLINI